MAILKLTIQSTNIYALVDPRTNQIRYIGVTKNSLKSRLNCHIRQAKQNPGIGNKHKNYWIRQLLQNDLAPEIAIIEKCNNSKSAFAGEVWWIELLTKLNYPLVNIAKGGDKPPSWKNKKHSEITKKKQSKSIRAYYANNEHPSKGTNHTKNHRDRIRASRKKNGTKSNPETMLRKRASNPNWFLNLSKAQKKRFANPNNNPMYGKRHTELSNQKNSLAQRMRNAYLKDDYFLVCELQEDWLNLVGEYKSDYGEFIYD